MAEQTHQPGELALVKAVRSLDQGGSEAIPDKLDQVWKILSVYPGGKFHAAEEMLVRWLLKNMNGSSADAQKLRRYPLTWRILGRVFSSIPLFSLAKSLADRRFVQVLQAALKDASEPRTGAEQKQSSDVEMADADSEQARPRKRQRSETAQFDLGGQGTTSGCLRTAEALFEALRALLARLESPPSGNAKRDNHMGAEHIKSLFCSTAAEIKDLIVPALKICQLAVHSYDVYDRLEGQESWISTVRDIWDLHLQGNGDALEVATHFARSTIDLHGRLNSIPGPQLRDDSETIRSPTMPEEVARLWRQDLKRFMARSFILPARAAFLNNRDLEIMRLAIESTTGFSTIGCSVLLDLTLSSPSVAGSQTAKRDNDSWTQAVFSLLEETLQSSSSKHRLAVVQDMLTQIKKHKVALSADSLRSVCLHHGMQPDGAMWGILSTIAELNPDVFIIREGDDLLQAVIDRLPVGDSVPAKAETINRIAAGFAKARDLQGFIKIWFRHLAAAGSHTSDSEAKDQYQIWYSKELRDTISESLEKTMSAKQILSLVDWLDSQADKPAENAAVILAMGAVSEGITQDDVTDEVGTRIFGIVFKKDLPPAVNDAVLTCKWAVARRSLHWATLEQGSEIWTTSVTQLRHTLAKLPLADASAFEAFKFAAAAWVANRPSGKYEAEAAELTLSVLSQLSDTQRIPADSSAAQRVIEYLTDSNGNHRLLSAILEHGNGHALKILKSVLSFQSVKPGMALSEPVSRDMEHLKKIFRNDINTNSRATMDAIFKLVCADMRKNSGCEQLSPIATALLVVPDEAISREYREELMALLVTAVRAGAQDAHSIDFIGPLLSLMVKLMRKPTFYADMAFSDVYSAATMAAQSTPYTPELVLHNLPLVEELAMLMLRQMKANVGVREEQYFKLAISSMAEQLRAGTDHHTALAIVLLKTLILATKGSKSAKGLSTLDAREIENYLVGAVKSVIEQFCSKWSAKSSCEAEMSLVSVALAAADDVTRQFPEDKLSLKLSKAVSPYLGQLAEVSQQLGSNTDVDIWPLRRYLAKTHGLEDKSFLDLGQTTGGVVGDEPPMITASNDGKREGILEYVDAVTADADDATRVKLLDTLLSRRSNAPSQLAQLLAVHRIVQQFEAKTLLHTRGTAAKGHDGFDLATAHTILCRRLRTAETQAEFLLITEILETILDDKSSTMTQWNVELTLSTASVLASEVRTHKVMSITPKAYPRLCRLVQVIVRRHRLRLEGHFHLLVSVLQSLLRALICYPYQAMDGAWEGGLIKDSSSFTHWAKHAKAFARLVTMVCEPTPGSVARSQQSSLDSATDAAKRYAGQYMYLVLMLYIKLQLEQNVPHDVREALEPGVFAVLDITSPEGRRIMNDALDASGRAIMKDLYKQYLKFGKWSGI